jgi:hypothetical protein
MANIIKVKNNDINLLTLTIGSFDYEIYNIIKDHDNYKNLSIHFEKIPKHARHRLHTFSRKEQISIYAIGDSVNGNRDMVAELTKEYIEYICKHCKLNQELKSKEEIKKEKIQELLENEFSKFKIDIIEKIKLIL